MINPRSGPARRGKCGLSDRTGLKSNPVRFGSFFLLLLALLVVSGCGTVQVETARDPAATFRNYRTFNFKAPLPGSNPAYMSKINQERVRNAITQELVKRGLTLSALSEQPDLLVSFYLRVKRKSFDLEHPTAEGDSVGATMANYFGFYYKSGQSLNQQDTIPYHEGTLVIDVIDVKKDRLVWQGIVTGVLYPGQPDDQIQRRIQEAVHAAFKRFPR